jgi:isochorismate synthase
MSAYALYRLPHADQYTQIEGETCECLSCTQLNGQSGFVVAPFEVKEEQPIVLIRPDKVTSHPSPLTSHPSHLTSHLSPLTSSYSIDFANYHSQLLQGTFRKIVLARQADETTLQPIDPVELFHCACQLYPRMFIALVYTPQSGTWLTATPEILLEGSGCDWRTIALAGTMRLEDGQLDGEGENTTWSTKNIEEQRVVATYIAQCLEQFANDFREEGPRTVRAANLVHLRSDFTFTLPSDDRIGDLLQQLHPTPAVCGLPKREAFQFIIRNEYSPRRYYSGFMGPLQTPSTHLYVSLRCMNIEGNIYHLYAGGGLLRDSTLEQEWQETEAKLETMRRCLVTKRM